MSHATTRYIAFLRGMNVGGHRVSMAELRTSFESLGLTNVETFIASGNVIFDASATHAADELARTIEQKLRDSLGYSVSTFLRTLPELDATIRAIPFAATLVDDPAHSLHVGFLRHAPSRDVSATLEAAVTTMDELRVVDRALYWLCRGKISGTLIKWPSLERRTKLDVTMRNITTLRRLASKYSSEPEQ